LAVVGKRSADKPTQDQSVGRHANFRIQLRSACSAIPPTAQLSGCRAISIKEALATSKTRSTMGNAIHHFLNLGFDAEKSIANLPGENDVDL